MDRLYRYIGWLLLICAALIGLGRAVAIRWWQVPPDDPELDASVAPSVRGGDWVLLWRLTRPGIGDLVMCPDPDDDSNVVIGRILAEAGDEVVIDKQGIQVNGASYDVEYNCTEKQHELVNPDTLEPTKVFCDMENVGGKLHMRGYIGAAKDKRRLPVYRRSVSQGEIFLASDNRAFPFDSRHYGNLRRATCSETIFFRVVGAGGFFDHERRFQYVP